LACLVETATDIFHEGVNPSGLRVLATQFDKLLTQRGQQGFDVLALGRGGEDRAQKLGELWR
jgi:hypothetical protein